MRERSETEELSERLSEFHLGERTWESLFDGFEYSSESTDLGDPLDRMRRKYRAWEFVRNKRTFRRPWQDPDLSTEQKEWYIDSGMMEGRNWKRRLGRGLLRSIYGEGSAEDLFCVLGEGDACRVQ